MRRREEDDLAPATGLTVGAILGGLLFALGVLLFVHAWAAVFGA